MRSVERLLGIGSNFPVKVAFSSGARHVIDHPNHATLHPRTKDLIIFPDDGEEFSLAINPAPIVSIKPLRKKSKAA